MAKRALPEINAGSMADIAFLLLIFFLVTTTMDVDSGISRKLPPWQPEQENTPPPPIKKKNIFTVLINRNDDLLVEDEYMEISGLREAVKLFVDNNGDGKCEECRGKRLDDSSDNPGKAIVSIQNDRGTGYEMYIAVQNEITAAYNELRDELAQRKFGTSYESLTDEAREEVEGVYPMKISEAEPVSL